MLACPCKEQNVLDKHTCHPAWQTTWVVWATPLIACHPPLGPEACAHWLGSCTLGTERPAAGRPCP